MAGYQNNGNGSNNANGANTPMVPRVFTKNTGKYQRVVQEKGVDKDYEIISILLTEEAKQELLAQLDAAQTPIKLEIGITSRTGQHGDFLSSYVKAFTGKQTTQGGLASGAKKKQYVPKTRTA